jgi:hypothetical protein
MKLKLDITKAVAVAGAVLAVSSATTFAGPVKEVAPPPVVEEADPFWGGSLTVGYDSTYIFRGSNLSDDNGLVWTNLGFTLFDHLNLGAWYASVPETDYSELNLTASVGYSVGIVDLAAGVIWYYFPDAPEGTADDTFEPFVSANVNLGEVVDWFVYGGYDTEEDGWYFYTSVSAGIPVTDWLTLTPLAGIGYGVDYYNDPGSDSDFNQVDVRLTASFALSKTVTFSPYIAGVFPLDAIDDSQDDEVYGGAAFSVSF